MLLAWSWILSAILYNAVGVHLWTEFQQGRTDLASLFSDFKYFYGFLLNFSQSFDLIGWQLGYIQAIACVEIFHALFGLTTSSVLTSIIQLGSRNAIIWGYLIQFGSAPVRNHFSFSTMVFAWASADILRYAYYLFPSSKILRWLRYTVFYILYPIGAASEFYLVVLSIESAAGAVQRSCHFSSLAALHLLLFFPGKLISVQFSYLFLIIRIL